MKVKFCKSTDDITCQLSKIEIKELKRDNAYVPVLTAESEGFTFHVSNSSRVKDADYIQLKEPRDHSYLHYHIKLSDRAYQDLVNNGECGTRYGQSSKLNIIIDEEL